MNENDDIPNNKGRPSCRCRWLTSRFS